MLVDQRTYTVKPGTMAKQMALYQEYGMVPQKRHLGEPLAYLITESGEVNTFCPYVGLQGRRRPRSPARRHERRPGMAHLPAKEPPKPAI